MSLNSKFSDYITDFIECIPTKYPIVLDFVRYIFIERGDYRNQRIGAGRIASIKVEFIEAEDNSLCLSQQ